VFLGNGDGTFTTAGQYPTGASNPSGILAGDFNNDGNIDLVTIDSAPGGSVLSVLLGNGNGSFQPPVTTPLAGLQAGLLSNGDSQNDGAGDFNGDGKLDLVIGNLIFTGTYTFQTVTLLGNGDGTFQAPADPVSIANLAIAFADLRGDGKLDMVVDDPPFAQVFLGNGDGSFTTGQSYYLGFNAAGNVVTGDFKSDGKPDVAVAGAMLLGNGDGTFQAAPAVLPGGGQVATADFNGDGKPDMAVIMNPAPNSPELFIFLGNGKGQFSLGHSYPAPGFTVVLADVNGDGKPDLVFANESESTWGFAVMLGNGDGSFGPPIVTSGGSDSDGTPQIAIGDFNGDGKPDIAAILLSGSSGAQSVFVFLGNGDGTFAAPVSYFAGSSTSNVVAADFNNDRRVDLAVSSAAGLAILLGNGDGTFRTANFVSTTALYVFAAADLNNDVNVDLLASGTVFLGNGNGTFKAIAEPDVQSGILVDLNGDGT